MNLFVQPECLPQNLPEMPLKDENPDLNDDQDGVNAETVALKDSVSTYRQEWGG
jgi:hypothetical protein